MSEFAAHSVVIHTIETVSAVALGSVTASNSPTNTEVTRDDSGALHDTVVSVSKQEPTQEITTKSVALALAAITPDGQCLNTDATHPGVSVYFEQKKVCPNAAPGASDHAEFLFDVGLMTPQSLSASGRDQDVTLSFMIDALTDGTNEPYGRDYSASLPSSVDTSQFVLAAVRSGGIVYADITQFELDFGIEKTEKRPILGGVWPDQIGVAKARPSATLTTKELRRLDDTAAPNAGRVPMLGKSAAHADTTFWFRRRNALDSDAVHFTLTMAGLLVPENAISASGTGTGDQTYKLYGVNDGTNAPVVLTPNIAYSPGF